MSLDSDVVLIGTGLAPLVAAHHLGQRGLSVLLLNPDGDFFLEDSELPFDPLWPDTQPSVLERDTAGLLERILRSTPARALAELQPSFPGTVETWSEGASPGGFRDPEAPHLRQRGRLWVASPGEKPKDWERLEELYVACLDHDDLNPQLLEGLQALSKFPGFGGRALDYRGLWLPRFADMDAVRYRNGVLEFVRERLGDEKVVCGATQFEMIPEGIRFTAGPGPKTARIRNGALVFWTPRLVQWVLSQARQLGVRPVLPRGIRVIEQWALVSRHALDPRSIAALDELVVWARTSGAPPAPNQKSSETDPGLLRLAILRQGPLLGLDLTSSREVGASWASGESFESLRRLCLDLLAWNRISIRSMRPRAMLEWGPGSVAPAPWKMNERGVPVHVIPQSDGPIVDVVRAARRAAELIEGGDARA